MSLIDDPEYLAAIAREHEATEAVMACVSMLADVAGPVAHWGDGNCGWVLYEVQKALTDAGLYRTPAPPQKRTPASGFVGEVLRTQVYERDLYRCVHCGTHIGLSIDHIIPTSKGGLSVYDNLQTLCRPCNSRKGDR